MVPIARLVDLICFPISVETVRKPSKVRSNVHHKENISPDPKKQKKVTVYLHCAFSTNVKTHLCSNFCFEVNISKQIFPEESKKSWISWCGSWTIRCRLFFRRLRWQQSGWNGWQLHLRPVAVLSTGSQWWVSFMWVLPVGTSDVVASRFCAFSTPGQLTNLTLSVYMLQVVWTAAHVRLWHFRKELRAHKLIILQRRLHWWN